VNAANVDPMGTNRLESFSDGVIAVAITLLVLGITVPKDSTHLASDLGGHWPEYLAYVISFLTIGIIWINHHAMISRLREADHTILILNLLLLLTIAVLPFATQLVATYRHQSVAAAVYSGCFMLMALVFSLLNRQVLIVRDHLLSETLPLERRRQIWRRAAWGVLPYVLATGLAFVSPTLTLAICAVVAVYYATPLASRA
jgi:TMEM175 potassium channel family protein